MPQHVFPAKIKELNPTVLYLASMPLLTLMSLWGRLQPQHSPLAEKSLIPFFH